MSQSSPDATMQAELPGPPALSLRGRWLLVVRCVWLLIAAWLLASWVTGLFPYVGFLHTVCTTDPARCAFWQLTPGNVQALHHLGLSVDAYAAYFITVQIVVSLVFFTVSALIFWRKSNEWMGLAVSLLLINFGASGISATLSGFWNTTSPLLSVPSLVFGPLLGLGQWPALAIFLLTFPTGQFAPRWTWMVVLLWIVQEGFFWVGALGIFIWPGWLLAPVLLTTWGSTAAVQIYRYRRVYTPMQRQQTKWVMFGLATSIVIVVLANAAGGLVPGLNAPDAPFQLLNGLFTGMLFVSIPLAVGIAILRYRLWDIDLLINRALVYGGLTAGVISIYVLIVGYLGALFRAGNNPAISLLATGLVAVLFQPLRQWLQRGVNRLMYGRRDDPYAVLARLGQRLEGTLAPKTVLPTIVETIAQTLKLPYVAIALATQHQTSGAALDSQPSPVANEVMEMAAAYGTPGPQPVKLPLVYQQETVGYLLLGARAGEALGRADLRLLADLARQAGVAAYAVRLTTDLQRLTTDLQQARERLVTAREEERRRLRRDLHDGLGPALASLSFKVDAARNLLRRDPERAETVLLRVTTQAQEAIADIRRLVYELRPPALDELGLVSALREQMTQQTEHQVQITLEAPERLPSLSAAVEVAAYRIAQEALTNVLRHAHASQCILRMQMADGTLCLEIADDGQGLPAQYRAGVGLRAMAERAAELGGRCSITPGPTGGTVVHARLPLPKEPIPQPTTEASVSTEGVSRGPDTPVDCR
jgi:signal transduction histidine kinase